MEIGGVLCLCGMMLYAVLVLSNRMVSMVSAQFQNPLLYLLNGCLDSWLVRGNGLFQDRRKDMQRFWLLWAKHNDRFVYAYVFC